MANATPVSSNVPTIELGAIYAEFPLPDYDYVGAAVPGREFGMILRLTAPVEIEVAGDDFAGAAEALEKLVRTARSDVLRLSQSGEFSQVGLAKEQDKVRQKCAESIDAIVTGFAKRLDDLKRDLTPRSSAPVDLTTDAQKILAANKLAEIRQQFRAMNDELRVFSAVLRAASQKDQLPLRAIETDPLSKAAPIISSELLQQARQRWAAWQNPDLYQKRSAIDVIKGHVEFNKTAALRAIGMAPLPTAPELAQV
jgi:hypothetical protein